MIQLIHPDLMQAFFTSQQSNFPRFKPLLDYLERFNKMTEDEEWKKKRKIISEVLHFELLTTLVPTMVKVTDQALDCCVVNQADGTAIINPR
jgi:cytochrome P450